MTALDDQPSTHRPPQQPAVDRWEWHEFAGGTAPTDVYPGGSAVIAKRDQELTLAFGVALGRSATTDRA